MLKTKIFAIAVALVAGAALVHAAPSSDTPREQWEDSSETDAGVRAVADKFIDAWNRHDTAALAGLWTESGDYVEPDGRTVSGPKEIKRLFDIEHGSVFKNSELNIVVERVKSPSEEVAIADGTYELFNATDPAGNEIGTRTGYVTIVLVKEGNDWKVSASRLMLPVNLIWRAQ